MEPRYKGCTWWGPWSHRLPSWTDPCLRRERPCIQFHDGKWATSCKNEAGQAIVSMFQSFLILSRKLYQEFSNLKHWFSSQTHLGLNSVCHLLGHEHGHIIPVSWSFVKIKQDIIMSTALCNSQYRTEFNNNIKNNYSNNN